MSHKTRAEQFDVKARKDPHKLARKTKRHTPKNAYKRVSIAPDLEAMRYDLEDTT